jgi:alkanesulfonate monooxygenase SsuD/methylene tetrahydromethanopterin reductase-like flavin-dependent oxidoreductase (luciferase family)
MRIGMFTAVQWSPEENPAAFLKALREQVRAARDNGFSSLLVGQHLLTGPMGMFQTLPLLGHLVEDAAGMQIGPGVLLLSMMNPVLAAEEAATLDWLSEGNMCSAPASATGPRSSRPWEWTSASASGV